MQLGPERELEPALDRLLAAVDHAQNEEPATLESLFESLEHVNRLATTSEVDPSRFSTVRSKLDLALARVSGVVERLNAERQRIQAELLDIDALRRSTREPGNRLDLTF